MGRKKLYRNMAFLMACLTVGGIFATQVSAKGTNSKKEITQSKQSQKRNVTYYGDWSIWEGEGRFYPNAVPADQLTHLNYAFVDFDSNGNLILCDPDAATDAPVGMQGVTWGDPNAGLLNAFQVLKEENPNLKIGVSLGGWSKSGDFSEVAANATKRKNLIDNTLKFIRYANMDFVDLDWEYPCSVRKGDTVDNKNDEGTPNSKPEDKQNYVTLLEEFKAALNKQGEEIGKTYELSVALPAPTAKVDEGIDVAGIFRYVDFANIMTYDMRGAWDKASGHQTPLYTNPKDPEQGRGLSVDESVKYYMEKGAPADKIVVGAAYYTRGWEQVSNDGIDPANPGLFGAAAVINKDSDQTPSPGAENEAPCKVGDGGRKGGVWSYRGHDKLKAKYPGLKEYWDDSAKAPYMYDEKSGAFFTYDNVRSIQEKTNYVNQNNLGGMISWMASQDKPTNSDKRDELTKATKEGLFGSADLPDHEIVYDALDVQVSVKPFKESWSEAGGYDITITNKEKAEENGALRKIEAGAETVKNGKLYIKAEGNKITGGDYTAGNVTFENGYAIVDLGASYEGKLLGQGSSHQLRLLTEKAPSDASGIKSIELTQRIAPNSPEMARQTIFGESGPTDPEVNTKPVINGTGNVTIEKGESFNPLAGVTANDKEDGDLTSAIKVTGTVDTNKVGKYTLTYKVSDSKGLETTATRVVTVVETETPNPDPEQNTAPVLKGVRDQKIKAGDKFDPLAGVTASDKEDGDLTSKIKVAGTVDTNKAGKYTLTYTVEDSKGLKATEKATITVEDVEVPPTGDTYDPNKVYNSGDKVIYKGKEYTAKWWVKGEAPDSSAAWEVTPEVGQDGAEVYVPGKAYSGGQIVSFNGKKYKANWWTQSKPDSNDGSWSVVK